MSRRSLSADKKEKDYQDDINKRNLTNISTTISSSPTSSLNNLSLSMGSVANSGGDIMQNQKANNITTTNNNDNNNINQNQISVLLSMMQSMQLEIKSLKETNNANNQSNNMNKNNTIMNNNNNINQSNLANTNPNTNGIDINCIGRKETPTPLEQKLLLPSIQEQAKAKVYGDDKTSITEFVQQMSIINLPTPAQELTTIVFTPFTNDMINNVEKYITWEESTITTFKLHNMQYYLVNSWVNIVNVINNNCKLAGIEENIRNGLIMKIYKQYKLLYFKLLKVIENELIVYPTIKNEIKLYANDPNIFIEGNLNYLYRLLNYHYENITSSNIAALENQYQEIYYPGKLSVINTAEYLIKIEEMRNKLNRFKIHKDEIIYVEKIKSGIPAKLRNILYSQLLNNNQFTSVKNIIIEGTFNLCKDESTDLKSNNSTNYVDINKNNSNNKNNNNNKSNRGTHNNNQTNYSSNSSIPTCSKCNRKGHTATQHYDCPECGHAHNRGVDCFNKNKYNNSNNINNVNEQNDTTNNNENNNKPFFIGMINIDNYEAIKEKYESANTADENGNYTNSRNELILDSGCSVHITCNRKFLFNIKKCFMSVRLPDGKVYTIHEKGSMMITQHFWLQDVLFMPKFQTNLISIGRLLDNHLHSQTEIGGYMNVVYRNISEKRDEIICKFIKQGSLFIYTRPSFIKIHPRAEEDKDFNHIQFKIELNKIKQKIEENKKIKEQQIKENKPNTNDISKPKVNKIAKIPKQNNTNVTFIPNVNSKPASVNNTILNYPGGITPITIPTSTVTDKLIPDEKECNSNSEGSNSPH